MDTNTVATLASIFLLGVISLIIVVAAHIRESLSRRFTTRRDRMDRFESTALIVLLIAGVTLIAQT